MISICIPIDLHNAWLSKSGYFFGVLSLTIVSSFFYLVASLMDPGYLPKADLTQNILASFSVTKKSLPPPTKVGDLYSFSTNVIHVV